MIIYFETVFFYIRSKYQDMLLFESHPHYKSIALDPITLSECRVMLSLSMGWSCLCSINAQQTDLAVEIHVVWSDHRPFDQAEVAS